MGYPDDAFSFADQIIWMIVFVIFVADCLSIMTLSAKQLAHSDKRRERLVELCTALPEVTHEIAGNEHIAFRVRKKIFAYYLFDHHGDGMIAFCCKSTLNEQRRFVRDDPESFFVPAYVGPKGWVAIRLDLDEVDWETVNELARQAFQSIAPRKLAALVENVSTETR